MPQAPQKLLGLASAPSSGGTTNKSIEDADAWYLKPFWRKAWMPLGATVLFGEYGQYNDQFSGNTGSQCGAFTAIEGTRQTTNIGNFCSNFNSSAVPVGVFVTGSEVQRYGLGVVQEIDSAAMHLFARRQHQEIDVDFLTSTFDLNTVNFDISSTGRINQSFDDWDLFQVGGVIFF